jgi:hypothetical protein
MAPVILAEDTPDQEPPPPSLTDQLHEDADVVGEMGNEAGHEFLHNAGQALVFAGKAVINGVEFVILKTAQGTILVAAATVRGLELAYAGAKFIAIKTKDGILWVCEKALIAGEILVDAVVETVEIIIDGVTYVAVKVAEGCVFVAKKTYELAVKTGELIVKGTKYVIKKTKDGIVWVAKTVALKTRRAALVAELRWNISGALAGGGVADRTMDYFRKRSTDKDPVIARLGAACLTAAEAFNGTYY